MAGALLLFELENNTLSLPFAGALVATLASAIFAVSHRLAFSVYSAWALTGTISVASAIKFTMKGFSLHFYDLVVIVGDPDMYRFIFSYYLHLALPVVLLAFAAMILLYLVYRVERPRSVSRSAAAMLLVAVTILLPATYPAEAYAQHRYFYYLQGRHTSAFFVSLLDVVNVFGQGELETRLASTPPAEPFPDTVACGSDSQPDVYVILEESHADPAIFPQIGNGDAIARDMEANAGRFYPLQVETFGGGTWISNLSMMTGLSGADFGWRSPYLTISLEGHVAGALPEVFSRCGYRTAAILPFNYTFVNEGSFLSSIGFETILDMERIDAPGHHLRDSFYLDAAETFIAEHRATDGRPLFLLVQTMFAHSPYNQRLEPEVNVTGEPLHADPEIAEYLRRMVIANRDLGAFKDRRRSEEGQYPYVLLAYGDHQVFATKPLVDQLEGAGSLARLDSLAYRTFYAFSGAMAAEAGSDDPVDIAFLGALLLRAVGIEGSPMFADLARLNRLCGGAFRACPHRSEIDRHLKRRIESGFLVLDPSQPDT
ncbi:sulfatase-like hydrolase/transferase [Nitratireductor sp. GCM10026969]|uniref:sulfatase-like hydrolase/transferase n=1 Tax=Nitratireductor sp. GCM10026969 TaxID=3252645 RepID=UPI0036189D70